MASSIKPNTTIGNPYSRPHSRGVNAAGKKSKLEKRRWHDGWGKETSGHLALVNICSQVRSMLQVRLSSLTHLLVCMEGDDVSMEGDDVSMERLTYEVRGDRV
jgi:hypothetical protein